MSPSGAMIDTEPTLRSPAAIAKRILDVPRKRRLPCARQYIEAMAKLAAVNDEASYALVASVRRDLGSWRGAVAREIKDDLDTALTLYRVERCERA